MGHNKIVTARIHPAIGIARVGNSKASGNAGYFLAPETLNPPVPEGGYRDDEGCLRRQAARFRIYGYDLEGRAVEEIKAGRDIYISWTVHVANTKAAWHNFDIALDIPEAKDTASGRRNPQMRGAQRGNLVIDPGPKTVSGANAHPKQLVGSFWGCPVYLGEIQTDGDGRLVFLGGHGKSSTPFLNNPVSTFADNTGWHDDTSDGPVSARVILEGREIPVDPAWVVTAPPNYAPGIVVGQTMYDVIYDVLVRDGIIASPGMPSFTRDILPIFQQLALGQWVNFGFQVQFGWGGIHDFSKKHNLERLAAPSADPELQERRLRLFYAFRNPDYEFTDRHGWPPLYGDAYGDTGSDSLPRAGLAITATRYNHLRQWSVGNFASDYSSSFVEPDCLSKVDEPDRPDMLDRAALYFCTGGPFHPGCEMTWPMRHSSLYRGRFRLKLRPPGVAEPDWGDVLTPAIVLQDGGPLSASGPGDLTRWMAVPWQTDTASCRSGYSTDFYPDPFLPTFWAARVPNHVLTEENYAIAMDNSRDPDARIRAFRTRTPWLRRLNLGHSPYTDQIRKMLDIFGELGVLERREGVPNDSDLPPVMYVERVGAQGSDAAEDAQIHEEQPQNAPSRNGVSVDPALSSDLRRARFGRRRHTHAQLVRQD